jgi:quercetin dioxygenase-like cupin family protein
MFEKRSDRGYRPTLEGIERKTLVHGEKTLMTEFRMRKGAVLPRHFHPHEQTGYLFKGRIRLSIGTEEYNAQVGDSWCIPGGVEHGAATLEDSVANRGVFTRSRRLPAGADVRQVQLLRPKPRLPAMLAI